MRDAARPAAVIALVVLLLIGMAVQSDQRFLSPTSFGETERGFGALFELLGRLDLPVQRNLANPDKLPPTTIWLIEPPQLCAAPTSLLTSDDTQESLGRWIRSGGTAVVFLSNPSAAGRSCGSFAGLQIPPMAALKCEGGVGDRCRWSDVATKPSTYELQGEPAWRANVLEANDLRVFVPALEGTAESSWQTLLTVAGGPFAIERSLGGGRVVLVADSQFLRNRWLDRKDAALLAADLVDAFGVPLIDEWAHGFRTQESLGLYLLTSSALPVLIGVALSGLALFWYGAMVPVRAAGAALAAPSLDESVSALAAAYAATGDFAALQERYRQYAGDRLRRHLSLRADAPTDVILAALGRRRAVSPTAAAALRDNEVARQQSDLLRSAQRLDQLILEAIR